MLKWLVGNPSGNLLGTMKTDFLFLKTDCRVKMHCWERQRHFPTMSGFHWLMCPFEKVVVAGDRLYVPPSLESSLLDSGGLSWDLGSDWKDLDS